MKTLSKFLTMLALLLTVATGAWADTIDLSTLTADYEAQDGDVLTGTLGGNYKISVADGATVTLEDMTINGVNAFGGERAGITCPGDATIILKGENSVTGFYEDYPGIYIAEGKTLTIKGSGSLTATSNGYGAGIGGGLGIACGNIAIEGGTITATGGSMSGAGIGGGEGTSCGDITITGGTVTATGGLKAAGIGSGYVGTCGNITITDGVTSVTATKDDSAPNSIGAGDEGSCGTVTIGGTVGAITTSPYTYTGTGGSTVTLTLAANNSEWGTVEPVMSGGPVTYTELKGGEVLHVGDVLKPTGDVYWIFGEGISSEYLYSEDAPFTLIRANISGLWGSTVTPAEDGEYYVLQYVDSFTNKESYITLHKDMTVTDASDGISVTFGASGYDEDEDCTVYQYTFAVHEGSGSGTNSADIVDNGDGTYSVAPGSNVTVKATPAEGYHLASWSNGAEVNDEGTTTLTVGTDDITLTATFASNSFDLTVGESEHGTVTFTVDGTAATQAAKDDVVTVSVTPDDGYAAKDVTVRAYTSWEAAGAPRRAPSLLDEIEVTKNETDGTWTFTMPEANVWVVATYTKNLQDAWIQTIADQTYTGEAIEPTVTVKDGETTLTLGTDYTVAYSDNVETGTATVTVTGMGDYSGTATATFIIRADKTALNTAITEAETYYNSISETNPDAAAVLLEAINAAKTVQGNADATQTEIETATTTLNDAVAAAKADVALKRITLVIPAKSYVARVDADKRTIETAVEGVSLYSVKSVTDSEVELTAALSVVGAEMPYLIYNDTDEEQTISIVVSTDDADAVEYDSEHFKGTLTDKTFTDEDMQAADHYVLQNGQDFVWVKDAGTLAAGKCWIELVPASEAHARRLAIVHEGGTTTGINAVSSVVNAGDNWYSLDGRRLAGKPAMQGVYIHNGRKTVVR